LGRSTVENRQNHPARPKAGLTDALTASTRAGITRSDTDVLDSLLRLVTVDETGQPTRLEVNYHHLPPPVRIELDAFIDHRLLTTSTRQDTVLHAEEYRSEMTNRFSTWNEVTGLTTAA
jgi:hypothetical protein